MWLTLWENAIRRKLRELAEGQRPMVIETQGPSMSRYRGYFQRDVPEEDKELTHVGPGTPCGEYLRQYWQAIAVSSEIKDLPKAIRLLGEDLVLFRDLGGRVGLLHRHCSHRLASLEYGIISERGIRCCYHGWLYDIDGTILETPGEPGDSAAAAKLRETNQHGAYPACEYKGLIFAYLGHPDKTPSFPIYDTFEIPGVELVPYSVIFRCNWLQVTENGMDPVHSMFLHTRVSGPQFSETWGVQGEVQYYDGKLAVYCTIGRRVLDNVWVRVQENILPNITQSGAVLSMDGKTTKYFGRNSFFRWCVPIDDTNTLVVGWASFGDRTDPKEWNTVENIEKLEQGEVFDRSYEEEQRRPGDLAAQTGQGPIAIHKKEHLVSSDTGVAKFRARLRREIRALQRGNQPLEPREPPNGPIPTYSGDTVLRIPILDPQNDVRLIRDTVKSVLKILAEGDQLVGNERDERVILGLKELESHYQ